MTGYTDFDAIPRLHYGLIMADPAWSFKTWSAKGHGKAAQAHYRCSEVSDMADLPVAHLAAPDCLLWMWATNAMLPQAFDLMAAWGFTFKTAGHWSKKTAHGKQAFGTGYILRCAGEPFLIGTIGKPKTARNVRSVIEGTIREHSRKPEAAYAAAERLCGDVPRLDLFSRQEREGWDCWGDEINKFERGQG